MPSCPSTSAKQYALRLLRAHKPERRIDTNVEFYTALLLHGFGMVTALSRAASRWQADSPIPVLVPNSTECGR